jgi:phosphate starvation-inducible PhoH-like protein
MPTTRAKKQATQSPKKTTAQKKELNASDLRHISFNPSQKAYLNTILDSTISFAYGPAGTSKTFTACYAALRLYLDGAIDKIILSKPIQESGEKLGFLPGDVKEKIDPYMESYRSNLVKLLHDSQIVSWLEAVGVIEFRPLAYMRGATFDNTFMILDEAQNANFKQLMLFLTRLGKDSKMLICGDVSQYDISKNQVALPDFINLIKGTNGVGIHQFVDSDIVRNSILIEITERYEQWKNSNPNHAFLR